MWKDLALRARLARATGLKRCRCTNDEEYAAGAGFLGRSGQGARQQGEKELAQLRRFAKTGVWRGELQPWCLQRKPKSSTSTASVTNCSMRPYQENKEKRFNGWRLVFEVVNIFTASPLKRASKVLDVWHPFLRTADGRNELRGSFYRPVCP